MVTGRGTKPLAAPSEITNVDGGVTNRGAIIIANVSANYKYGFKKAASITVEVGVKPSQINSNSVRYGVDIYLFSCVRGEDFLLVLYNKWP